MSEIELPPLNNFWLFEVGDSCKKQDIYQDI
jgi:hypothetical protein